MNGRCRDERWAIVIEFSGSCELNILLLNWVRIQIIAQLIGGEGSEIIPKRYKRAFNRVLPVTDNCPSFNKKEWE